MTLHLIQISRRYTLHVSDRLVSGALKDPLANKSLIYYARRSVVSIGYTGLAYGLSSRDPNMPTDEWIAEVLWGKPIPRGHDGIGPITIGMEKIARWLDIGQSIELLKTNLQNSFNELRSSHRKYPFEIIVAGWQETRRRGLEPVVAEILKPQGSEPFIIKRPQRDWLLPDKFEVRPRRRKI